MRKGMIVAGLLLLAASIYPLADTIMAGAKLEIVKKDR